MPQLQVNYKNCCYFQDGKFITWNNYISFKILVAVEMSLNMTMHFMTYVYKKFSFVGRFLWNIQVALVTLFLITNYNPIIQQYFEHF